MHCDLVQRLEASIRFDAINGDAHERNICKRQMAEAIAEINRLREVERLARSVMTGLLNHGAKILPHFMDSDDNDGQRLRVALGMTPEPDTKSE